MFEHGDDTLIEELIKSGEPVSSVADKWDVTEDKLRTYCKRKGISLPKKSPEKNGCHLRRLQVEAGLRKSKTVAAVIRMQKTHSVDDIAFKLKKSKAYIGRIISVFVTKEAARHHSERVSAVRQLCNSKDITIDAACAMLGISRGAYQFSNKQIKKFNNKKAPA